MSVTVTIHGHGPSADKGTSFGLEKFRIMSCDEGVNYA
jgi:hypothetical protein